MMFNIIDSVISLNIALVKCDYYTHYIKWFIS